ncbi:metallophosphoesterase [Chthoniobacter flavus Ellin428]|uniref:Metallophosphoesterase n=1 Tax=Chthoniobacter flavus Ellin428 TaxID=497964 RepID=B4D4Z2_9BACT|nr:UDP-2,3-diacylglucosamine diphosphatase [Chthoniobacter flavus]EDY18595.1 metallophosphoesterase [Chthoniobacter flavus Ellin428]TCO90949.1 UDP-2,3-diacylglucosamine pyrophosphatase LpxH [Chthoniobacter flavus]
MKRFRTGWISDIHLGSKGSKADALLQFLREYEFEKLYIVGDFIDVWQLRRGIYWPQAHNDVIQKILRAGRKGTHVIYIPGNHDEFVAHFFGHFGAVEIMPRDIHTTADGRRLLVIHGHELDTVVQNIKWLAFVGDVGYQLLLKLNAPVNTFRRLFGLGYWSLSAYVKKSVKNAVSFIGAFENAIVQYAQADKVEGVVCGHIHSPVIRTIESTTYYNSGDWVESLSALVEDFNGHIELVTNFAVDATGRPPTHLDHHDDDEPATPTAPLPAPASL